MVYGCGEHAGRKLQIDRRCIARGQSAMDLPVTIDHGICLSNAKNTHRESGSCNCNCLARESTCDFTDMSETTQIEAPIQSRLSGQILTTLRWNPGGPGAHVK